MEKGLLKVNLKGKVVLVTGGAKGIGEAISIVLANNGADVVINYLTSEKKANELVGRLSMSGNNAIAMKSDVSVPEEVSQMFHKIKEKTGRDVDILVNNAGTQMALSTIEEMPIELWNKVIGINLTGAMLCSKFCHS